MSNVVSIRPENKGYNMIDDEVFGVFVNNICGMVSEDKKEVLIGEKSSDGVSEGVVLSMDDMNEFCLMWLLIYKQELIKDEIEAENIGDGSGG